MDPGLQTAMVSVFEDRARRIERYDTVAPTTVMRGSIGADLVGIHGFDAISGEDTIPSNSCMRANTTNSATSRIYVWQADSTGNIRTAVPLLVQTVTVRNANTGLYNRYPLLTPVGVTGRFYVGYSGINWHQHRLRPVAAVPCADRSAALAFAGGVPDLHQGSPQS